MASSSADIYVSFGADTGGLEAALALTKAQVTAMQRELTGMAREMQKTGAAADSELGQRMAALGGQLASAKASAKDISGSLGGLGHALETTGAAAAHGHTGIGFYVREIHALMDELGSGRDRQAIGTLSNLISTTIQSNLSLLPYAAAIAAVGGALGYLVYQALSAGSAMRSIELDAVIGQFRLTDAQAQSLTSNIARLANVGNSAAAEIAKPFLALGQGGDIVAKLVAADLPLLAKQMGEDAPRAAEKLAVMFAELSTKGRAYLADTHGVTGAQLQLYDSFVASNQSGQAWAMLVDAIKARLDGYAASLKMNVAAMKDEQDAAVEGSTAASEFGDRVSATATHVDELTASLKRDSEAARENRAALLSAADAQKTYVAGLQTATKVDEIAHKIRAATAEIDGMKAALANTPGGDAAGGLALARSISIAEDRLKELQQRASDGIIGDDAVARMKQQLDLSDAVYKGSEAGRLQTHLDAIKKMLAGDEIDEKQRRQLTIESAQVEKQIRDAQNESYLRQTQAQIDAAGKKSAQRISLLESEVRRETELYGAGSKQAEEAEDRLARAKEEAASRGAAAAGKAAREATKATEEGFAAQIAEAEKAAQIDVKLIELRVKAHVLSAKEGEAATLAAIRAERAAVDDLYNREMQLAGLTAAQVGAIRKKMELEDLTLDGEIRVNAEKTADSQIAAWQKAGDTIMGSWNGQLRGLLQGTTSFKQASAKILEDLTIKGIEEAEKLAVGTLAKQLAGLAAKKTLDATAVSGDAGRAAAGAYASTAEIPIIGPVLAPAAAAAAYAGTMAVAAFDIGAWSIPHDQLAMVHRNELVMPAAEAGAFRSLLSGAANGGGSPSRSVTVAPNFHFHSMDSATIASTINQNRGAFVKAISAAVRDGAHHGLRGLR